MIRCGVPSDHPAAPGAYRRACLSNAGDHDSLLAHPEHLVLEPEGPAEGRTYAAEEQGLLVGFATWAEAGGIAELEPVRGPGLEAARDRYGAGQPRRADSAGAGGGVSGGDRHAMGSTARPDSSTGDHRDRSWHCPGAWC